ncbi:MAG: ATP-dependent Clp protease adaptor ClpS [Phycisphaerales bacterium]|nr:ATP-dependent Clp protease adaptor ClpS [Phycisphaerales bacterium]
MNESEMNPEQPKEKPGGSDRGESTTTAVREKQAEKAPARVDQLPPFRVILHNEDTNDMDHVVETVVALTPHGRTRAVDIMLTAHTRGLATLLVTHRERAELYVEQLRSKKLTVTMERTI